jgi:hypothetical protein
MWGAEYKIDFKFLGGIFEMYDEDFENNHCFRIEPKFGCCNSSMLLFSFSCRGPFSKGFRMYPLITRTFPSPFIRPDR